LQGFDAGRRQDRLPHALASFEHLFVSEQAIFAAEAMPGRQ
jgi:hypothetical protein